MSSTITDYMRFCQMLLNGGELGDVRLLKDSTVKMMTANQIAKQDIPGLPDLFGFGFSIYPNDETIHAQLRDAYDWLGYWNTSFKISPRGDWILITMPQVAYVNGQTPQWLDQYKRLAAKAVTDRARSMEATAWSGWRNRKRSSWLQSSSAILAYRG